MKLLMMTAAALALMTGSAQAYDYYDDWDCGYDLLVTQWNNELFFYIHEDRKYSHSITHIKDVGKTTLKGKDNVAVRIEWDFTDHPVKLTANGKVCHSMSDMDWSRERCRRREDKGACEIVRFQEKAERNDRISCKDDPASVACENVKEHKQWLQGRKEECKKFPTLLICKKSVTASHARMLARMRYARMRHDRPCDIAQDKADPVKLNPRGGNGILFGSCDGIRDAPLDASLGRGSWWHAFNCGYEAYRQCKVSDINPYRNETLQDGWDKGWEAARKACTTGRRPFYPPKEDDADSMDRLMATAVLPFRATESKAPPKKWCR